MRESGGAVLVAHEPGFRSAVEASRVENRRSRCAGHRCPTRASANSAGTSSVYRTNSENDIYGISTSIASGFFQNVGSTRREGGDLDLTYQTGKVSAYLQYSYLKATFRSAFLEPSPANPFQDANGNIQVNVGDELPLIPKNRVKLGADVEVLPALVGGRHVELHRAVLLSGR